MAFLFSINLMGQSERWQQRAEYSMELDVDVNNFQFAGSQSINYTNNSPDTLDRIFYHLYYNAFQPGSMMDERSRTISDPDPRVADRISQLSESEIGYQKISNLRMDGTACKFITEGTILEVNLPRPILPGKTVKLELDFVAQIPAQIRRTGRNNAEGISLSMTQWYPKLCEYDYQGWHSNPYIGREFYGVWGNFDVTIKIDKDYMIGGTGVLKNAKKIGMGYAGKDKAKFKLGKKRTWMFEAKNVHDFAWAADPDYTHEVEVASTGTELHYIYQKNEQTEENWGKLHNAINTALPYINKRFGEYPYPVYYFLQGGDGGMEYAMCTLITGHRSYESLVGVSIHELMHSWYQMVLGTNEALHPWMDEGFTSYATAEVMNYLRAQGVLEGEASADPNYNNVRNFAGFTQSGMEEPLSTHADHYTSNTAYGAGSYTKGSVALKQLEYIMGYQTFDKAFRRYYNEWKFKHPNPNDFIRVMEKSSGLELDWFKEYYVNTTHSMDYAVSSITSKDNKTYINLEKIGVHPMPVDVLVVQADGTQTLYNIPLRIMRGAKQDEGFFDNYKVAKDWPWTHANYALELNLQPDEIKNVVVDPTGRMADTNLENNVFPRLQPDN